MKDPSTLQDQQEPNHREQQLSTIHTWFGGGGGWVKVRVLLYKICCKKLFLGAR